MVVMRNVIAAIFLYIVVFASSLFGNEQAIPTISTFKKNPNHLYFGPEIFAFDLDTHFKDVRVHGAKFFMGLRLGYEYLKPDAFYFGIDLMGAAGIHGFHETFKRFHVPRSHGTAGFVNFELRFGYTLMANRWLVTPYFCNGAYAYGSGCHDHHFHGGMSYLGGGVRSLYEVSQTFNVGLNAKVFASIYTSDKFKFLKISRSNHHGQWGGELGVPLIWYLGSHKRWDIQLEPYFLKLDFSQVQNIYGLRLLFGCHF